MVELSKKWRVDNINQMKVKNEKKNKKYGDIPYFWTGDFNFDSDSEAYKKVIEKDIMKDSEILASQNMTGTKTTHKLGKLPKKGKSIDHIFGSKVIFTHHYICNSDEDLKASDHCAVYVDATIEK